MLSDADIELLMQVFQDRMQEVTDEYLKMIGEHIADIGTLLPSDINRLIEMKRVNRDMRAVKRKLAAASGKNLKDIAKIFSAVAESDSRFAKEYFGQRASAASMRRVIEAQLRVTYGSMKNISQTTIVSQPYRKAVDAAIQATQSGVSDHHSAVRRALRNCAAQGLTVTYPSGYTRRADSAVRQNVLDGVRAVNQQMLYAVGEEFGANGVEISAHNLCAKDHLPYQGRQFDADTFRSIQSKLRRPLGMWNCRHTIYPIILGISKPAYTEEQRRSYEAYSTEEITIDGDTKTRYEWSQEMRRTETAIRAEKDTATLLSAAGDATGERESVRNQQALLDHYKKVAGATGLKPEFSRTQASGLLPKAYNRDIMLSEGSKIEWHPITEESLASIQEFTDFDRPDMNNAVTNACRAILTDLKDAPIGTEKAISISVSGLHTLEETGDPGDGTVHVPAMDTTFVAVHNHPSNDTFSYKDIGYFIRNPYCVGIVVIGNDGTSTYILTKTEDYDDLGALRFKLSQEHRLAKFTSKDDFLKGLEKYGVRYVKRGS